MDENDLAQLLLVPQNCRKVQCPDSTAFPLVLLAFPSEKKRPDAQSHFD